MLTAIKEWIKAWPIWTRLGDWLESKGYKFDSNTYNNRMLKISFVAEALSIAFGFAKEGSGVPRIAAAIFVYVQYGLIVFLNVLYFGVSHIRPHEKPQQLHTVEEENARLTSILKENDKTIRALQRQIRKMELEQRIREMKQGNESSEEKEPLLGGAVRRYNSF